MGYDDYLYGGTLRASSTDLDHGTFLDKMTAGSGVAFTLVNTGGSEYVEITSSLLAGVSGGQTLIGGLDASDDLKFESTSHATKGNIIFGTTTAMVFDGVNGRLGIGEASPDALLHIKATDGTGNLTLDEESTNPASPDSASQVRMYLKTDRLVFQFNDAGTVRYKSMNMSGIGAIWSQSTTPP